MAETIAGWSQSDLRRFIVNQVLAEPGAVKIPTQQSFPSAPVDGDVPVWDATSKSWQGSSIKSVEGREVGWHLSATPPLAPQIGDLWLYNGLAGQFWLFVYDPTEATYKWKFVGGAPFYSANNNATAQTTGGWNYADDGADPSFTVGRAGDYQTRFQVGAYQNSLATSYTIVGAAIGQNSATPASTQSHFLPVFGNSRNGHWTGSGTSRITCAVGDVLKITYYTDNFGPQIYLRHLEVTPARVI